MSRIRAASLASLMFLLGGCASVVAVPSGIVDNFVPPQGQPVTTQLEPRSCQEAIARDPGMEDVKTIVPCAMEVLTAANEGIPRPVDQRRPRPPRMRR